MDISKTIAELKQDPEFAKNVGMILIHNGVVRSWARSDHAPVSRVEVVADVEKVEQIRCEIEQREGIYKVVAKACSGVLLPGDDLLFLIVAGDIRENVKPALALMLDRIKSEAVSKNEVIACP
ncbi:MAG: molybdenum cofactor biosynthesis protein MoaE [Deltaproteobacteria bacterium]|jgi:molybdopterin synthase catalytic subunit|nr:molybdenum cofactor biosynthesis protein MoaE [Deltaproteobacteria bacterium]MCW8892008.1 molybdenum cofactor biosynthesis protein MoaE [Deltaproteobacteria bacterium]